MARIDDITIGNCQAIATQLRGAYIPYYKELALSYSDTGKGTGKVIREQQLRIAEVMGLLGRAMGRGTTTITKKELKKLAGLTKKIREMHSQISKWVEASAPFLEDTEMALENISTTPKDLSVMTSILTEKRKKVGSLSQLTRSLGLPGIGRLGLYGVLSQVAKAAGPLAGPLMAGGVVSALAYKTGVAISQRRKRKKERGALPELAGVPKMRGKSGLAGTSGLAGMPGRSGLAGMPGLAGIGAMEGVPSTYPRDVRGRFVPRGGLTGIDNIEKALFKFFNVRAMKARWTRNMLRVAEKKGTTTGAMGGIFGSFSKLKALLPGLLLALGKGAGLAGAAAFTAWQLHKASKVAKEWWEVHKNASESIKKQTKLQTGLLENLSDTLMKKARVAGAAGDEVARKKAIKGVIETQKEILEKEEKPGLWETWKSGAGGIVSGAKRAVGIEPFEEGGIVTKPTIGLLGEKYKPEVVTPLSSGGIMEILKAIKENTANAMGLMPAPTDSFKPPFDLADPLLNQLNTTGSLNLG